MPVLMTSIETLPGVPAPEILRRVATALVEPHLACNPKVSGGLQLSEATGIGPLVERLHEFHNFTAKGSKKFEVRFGWNRWLGVEPMNTGSVTRFVDDKACGADLQLEGLIAAMQTLRAPFGFLSGYEDGFRERRAAHRDLVQATRPGPFCLADGFSGIAWRTVLGPSSVEFFGRDALAALPEELGSELAEGAWLLTPSAHASSWDPARWCEGEAAIIAALGVERFFDPASSTLPEIAPELAPMAPIPIKGTRSTPDGEVWEYHNGYPPPDSDQLGA